MRVALFGIEIEENLGLRSIHAAVTSAGHEAELFLVRDAEDTPPLVSALLAWKPDLVGLSMIFTKNARDFVNLARELRRLGYAGHITAGGHHASLHAPLLLQDCQAIDTVLHGEGEEGLVDLLAHLTEPQAVLGLSRRVGSQVVTSPPRPAVEDLDSRPLVTRPAKFDEYLGLPVANMLGSRGCYAGCTFCSIITFNEAGGLPRVRLRSPACIAQEMADLYFVRGVRLFNFHDDNFFLPKKEQTLARFAALRHELDQRKVGRIGIQVKSRPDTIDEEIVQALKQLGCYRVFLGVDSNSVKGLKALGRGIRGPQNHVALRILLKADLHVTFNLLAFEPDCTLEDLTDNIDFIGEWLEVPLNLARTEIYGGTRLEEKLQAKGALLGDMYGYDYVMSDARAQRAYEMYRVVLRERCFTGEGANLRAMAVDCIHQVLTHFWPERCTPELRAQVKGLIRRINQGNLGLMRAIIDFCASSPSEETALARAEQLNALRRPLDAGLMAEANALLAQFVTIAQSRPGEPLTPGFERGSQAIDRFKVLLGVGFLLAVTGLGLITLFGDNIKALFGMSTELAGETSVEKRSPPRRDLEKKDADY